ncbi:MAG: KEOPS complex subunit Cgi121 [Halobacteriota archaeon]
MNTSQIFIVEGSVHVDNLEDLLEKINIEGCDIALLNSDYIADRAHAELAAKKAIRSWEQGKKIARTLPMEVLLYASANRQINQALEMGVKPNADNKVVAVVIGDEDCVSKFKGAVNFREEAVLHMDDMKRERLTRFFDIKEEEIRITGEERIPNIIKERVVLFDMFK